MQVTSKIFMVRPINFAYNKETAMNNSFQKNKSFVNSQELALKEFDDYVDLLRENNVYVVVVQDTKKPYTPDSIFPNNWFSTHNGTLILYSMFAKNRRNERKEIFINKIKQNIYVNNVVDLSIYESDNEFLEGTGSMVLDRDNKIIYACHSPRTSINLLNIVSNKLGYKMIMFDSVDEHDNPIYHTNVVLSVCKDFVIICLDSIKNNEQKEILINSFKFTNKEIIDISFNQLNNYVGNMLEITNQNNDRLLVMSKTAKHSLTNKQLDKLKSKCKILSPDIATIETLGGGSARCMIAELF